MSGSKGTLLLTGANGGIAVGFVEQFLKSPHAAYITGYYGVRNPIKATSIQNVLKNHAPHNHKYSISTLDLSSLSSVRQAAKEINEQVSIGSLPPIRALVLNAGVQDTRQSFTDDGIEHTLAINYLHNFLLVLLLLQSMDKEHGRIVCIGSTQIFSDWSVNQVNFTNEEQKIYFTSVDKLVKGEAPIEDDIKAGRRRYATSKVLMIMFMYELQKRLDLSPTLCSISILGHDPGWVSTSIGRNATFLTRVAMQTLQYISPFILFFSPNNVIRTAAKTGKDLVSVSFDREKFGEYPKAVYIDGSEVGDTTPEAKDEEKWGKLWTGSLKWAQIKECDTVLENWR